MSSSSIRRGAVKTVEWWKHLRSRKRAQNKLVRKDGKTKTNEYLEVFVERPFMPAYDINNVDGSATLNLLKAALLPEWRATFKKMDDERRKKRKADALEKGE
jgi:hypothetical protein